MKRLLTTLLLAVALVVLPVTTQAATEVKPYVLNEPPPGQPYTYTVMTEGEGTVFGASIWTYESGYQVAVAVAQLEVGGAQWTYPLLLLRVGATVPEFAEGWTPLPNGIVVNGNPYVLIVGPSKRHPKNK